MVKKVFSLFVSCALSLCFLCGVGFRVYAEKPCFTGTRTVVLSADKSDMENFIEGGRAAFDLTLRATSPEWLEYQIATEGLDLVLTLSFSFESEEDYAEKCRQLLTYKPTLIYSEDNGITLIESNSARDFLNYLQAVLNSETGRYEKKLNEIFFIVDNEITVNSQRYTGDERLSVYANNVSLIKFDYVEITSEQSDNCLFERKITVRTADISKSDKEELLLRFEKVGEVQTDENENSFKLSVAFEAINQGELTEKTMECLMSATAITEKQEFFNEETVVVERKEYFDLQNLLKESGGFGYSYAYPSYVSELTSTGEGDYIYGNTHYSSNNFEVACKYKRPFQFSKVEISTNMNNILGKTEKKVDFIVPTETAKNYHEIIKAELQRKLIDGSVFNIYDEYGERHYEIVFSSFSDEELSDFGKAVIGASYAFEYNKSLLPFGESTVKEKAEVDTDFICGIPPAEICMCYELPMISIVDKDANKSKTDLSGGFFVAKSERVAVTFRSLDIFVTAIEALALCVPVIAIVIIVGKNKKRKTKK